MAVHGLGAHWVEEGSSGRQESGAQVVSGCNDVAYPSDEGEEEEEGEREGESGG